MTPKQTAKLTKEQEEDWKDEDVGAYITNVYPSAPEVEFAELSRIMGAPTSLKFCRSAARLGWIEYQAFRWIKDPSREKSWRDCIELFDDKTKAEEKHE